MEYALKKTANAYSLIKRRVAAFTNFARNNVVVIPIGQKLSIPAQAGLKKRSDVKGLARANWYRLNFDKTCKL
jgi:hypothetical protein